MELLEHKITGRRYYAVQFRKENQKYSKRIFR